MREKIAERIPKREVTFQNYHTDNLPATLFDALDQWSCDERGKNKQICLFNMTRWDSLGPLVFKNIIALIIEQRWLCSSRSKDILPPVLIQCRQHRWSTQPLSALRTAAKDAQGDFYKQFVICVLIYIHTIIFQVWWKSVPRRADVQQDAGIFIWHRKKLRSQKELSLPVVLQYNKG